MEVLLRTESYRRGFVYSSALSVVDNILAFVPSLLIAAYFGTQAITDVYYYLTGFIMLVVTFFGNVDVAVIIPEYMRLRVQSEDEKGVRFLNTIWMIAGGLVSALAILVSLRPLWLFGWISRFDEQTLTNHLPLLYCALPLLPLQTMVTLLNDALHSHKFFTLPMVSSITNRLVVIAALLFARHRWGMMSVLLGLQISFGLQIMLLAVLLRWKLRWRPHIEPKAVHGSVINNMCWAALGGVASLAASYVPIFLFSGLARGEVTGLNIAQRLIGVPMAFLAGQAAAVLGVKLNEDFARQDMSAARRAFENGAVLLALVLALVGSAGWLVGRDLIAVLYQRGAFDKQSTEITASVFRPLAWCLPFLGINALLARVFMAGQRIREAFWCQVIGNLVQIAIVTWAVRRWGSVGYPYAVVGFYMVYLLGITPVVNRFFPELRYPRAIIRCGAVIASALLVAGVFSLTMKTVALGFSAWQRVLTFSPLLCLVVVGVNVVLRICPELTGLLRDIRQYVGGQTSERCRGS